MKRQGLGQIFGVTGHKSLTEWRVTGKCRDRLGAWVKQSAAFPLRLYLLSGLPRWVWLGPGVVGACARSLLWPSKASSIVLRRFEGQLGCHPGGRLPRSA